MIVAATVLPWLRTTSRPPVVGGEVETIEADGGFFRVHFTREGTDGTLPDDDDGDGLPDVVEVVRDALGDARSAYDADGWTPLVGDDGTDGDAIDVYLRRLPVYGYASAVTSPAGGSSCFLQLDPDNSLTGEVMRSVVFHELHHCVQFRYTPGAQTWLYESGATWQQYSKVEDVVLTYASSFLWVQWLEDTDRSLSAADGSREYASFVFTKFWAERGGADPDRVRRLWEHLAEPDDATSPTWLGTLDRAANEEWGDSLDDVFLDHATWNSFACAGDDGEHYLSAPVGCTADTSVVLPPFVDGETVSTDEAPYTAAYRSLDAAGAVRLTCRGAGDTQLVAVDADGSVAASSSGDDVQVEVPDGGSARLIFAGASDRPLRRTCHLARPLTPLGFGSSGCHTAPGAPWAAALAALLWARRRR